MTSKPDMAAVTAIANPLAGKDKVLLFQNSDKTYGLRVEPRNLEDLEIKVSLGANDVGLIGRPLAVPSQLVSMVYKDTVAVYGITGRTDADLELAMVSPVLHKIKVKPVSGALAGCAQPDGEKGWLYFLVTEGATTTIGEWELSSKGVTLRTLSSVNLSAGSQLSAVYDPVLKKRWVVYQNTDNELVVFDAVKDKGYTINETDKVPAKTPLSLTIIPDQSDAGQQRIFTYFIAVEKKKKVLCFANAVIDAKGLTWDEADERQRPVPGNHVLLPWAQIGVHVDEQRKRTVVFGLETKTEGEEPVFNAIPHEWSSLEE